MLLTGTHPRTLDDKKRMALPKRVREQLGEPDTLFVTPGPDQCLWVYTRQGLEQLAERLDQAPATDAEARVFRRLYFAQTEAVDVDRTGRILVPERLGQFAGIQREVVLIGVRDHLELWDAARWQAYLTQHAPRFDQVAEGAFEK
jgi:MraZ protein